MIRYTQGNLLDAPAEALVNTVNEVGVMGKGIALMFRDAFPESAKAYEKAAARGDIRVGHIFVTQNRTLLEPRWILHFPTKKHWRHPSRIEWIREGLEDLVRVVRDEGIRSLAVPPLGCGNGGLDWRDVRPEIELALEKIPEVEVLVYEPTGTYQDAPKRHGVEDLTPARALIAELVRRYSVVGLDCSNLEAHKLAWFLERTIREQGLEDPLDLRFVANRYGPYADRLRHLLDGLDGSYLRSKKRLSDASPLDPIRFEDSKRETIAAYLESAPARAYLSALQRTAEIIDGFESPLGMELLATVDWLLQERKCEPTIASVQRGLRTWPGGKSAASRKIKLFDERLIGLALERLAPTSRARSGSVAAPQ